MAVILRDDPGPVLTSRTPRWELEADLEGGDETFGAEGNPTGDPIGGGEGYSRLCSGGDHVARSYEEVAIAFEEARAGEAVFVPADAEIDMGGREALTIPEGVTLASSRGLGGSEGGMVYSDVMSTPGLFRSGGDCVRISGLRIRGPYPHRDRIDSAANGIHASHFGLEIDNCDIWAFSVAATSFGVGASRGYVHHNTIHHTQRAGLGYGVSVSGGDVLIEANFFDYCRHHIASTGAPGIAYEARYNICGENANGHLFDVHGGRDRGDATDISGDWVNIHHNTFQCATASSVGIRGVPSQGAKIHHNWFYSSDPENIVRTSGGTEVYQNVMGPDRDLLDRLEIKDD